jgi:energy-coupling factor transporter ATP-binding protein EcfA2
MNPVVRVEKLSFHYNNDPRWILKNVSFTVAEGEVVGIVGPSGVGKSTLCYCLKGIIPHVLPGNFQGQVWINEINTRQMSAGKLAEHIGIVFQDPESQIVGLTVEEELAFGPENVEEAPASIMDRMPQLLKLVKLDGYLHQETYKLSGGQKQRLAIASALMMSPKILILDEPTSELDPLGRDEVYQAIWDLKLHKVTVILVDHHTEEMVDVVDRLLVMEDGRIVEDTTPRELFQRDLIGQYEWLRRPQVVQVSAMLQQKGATLQPISPFEAEFVSEIQQILFKKPNVPIVTKAAGGRGHHGHPYG